MTLRNLNDVWRKFSHKFSTLISDERGGSAAADVDTEDVHDVEEHLGFSTGIVLDDELEGVQVETKAAGVAADDDDPEPETPAADKSEKDTKSKPEAGVTRKDLAALNNKVDELKFTAEYWRGKAEGRDADEGTTETPTAPADASDDEVDKFIVDLNKKGPDEIRRIMRKEGYLSAADVQKMVRNEVRTEGGALLRNQDLMRTHPGLRDVDSAIFKETARQLKGLQGTGMSDGHMTAHAVKMAELELRQRGEWDGDGSEADEAEKERQERVKKQSGPGRRRGSITPNNKTKLTKAEKFIAEQMDIPAELALKHKAEHIVDER